MTPLPVSLETSKPLALWLGVAEVVLVREDLLPDGGGKKRRSLQSYIEGLNKDAKHIHLISYAGSHTAFTLTQLLPEISIHLYGLQYGGGAYEKTMTRLLNDRSNIFQLTGSSLAMTRAFNRQRSKQSPGHIFMKIGGSLGPDEHTSQIAKEVVGSLAPDFQHIMAVASGDLLKSIARHTDYFTGVLTQPLGIRVLKFLSLKNTRGVSRVSLGKRMRMMKELKDLTGDLWDPIFMGTVFSYLKGQTKLPSKLCIWVTCPTGINWIDE